MKTISEKINEEIHSMQCGGCIPNYEEDDFNAGNLYGFSCGFEAGVEFAQRWIPVKEELPENKLNEVYLVKFQLANKREGIGLATFFNIGIGDPWTIKGSCSRDITHWRPIEIK